ncbi:type II toxin-antitoxin system HicB family antitoxin [Bacillus sp. UNC438CL73TsuS30]|uniref:type II toxin-antitoxin system HicB family antitoxin n=1 Tax=Bacillus sp. UNC438CL73TsuS30 TaxID=1340434 RepID=UPI00068B1276|nr:type II toxin-antitoxin system HicB family antitoxin [Bacillus sp. UNC438CL73TsuS30]
MARSKGDINNRQQDGDLKRSYSFPAIFEYDEDGISVSFPDLPGAFTCGEDEDEAFRNAKEALGLHLFGMEEDRDIIPIPTKLKQLSLESNQAAAIVNVFMPLIRDRVKRATVKKTLTIPKWLNDVAEEHKINFSNVLQEALKERLGIKEGQKENHLY